MNQLFSKLPATVLAFYAHPDDADVSCGGTLARWSELGSSVILVVCTKGEKGTIDPSVDAQSLEVERINELNASRKIVGLTDLVRLELADGEVDNTKEFRSLLVSLIRKFKPEAVLCPDPTAVFFGSGYFNHRDHRELGWAVLDSVSPSAGLPHYFPESGISHQVPTVLLSGSLEADAFVDISGTISKKLDAVSCHKTQIGERAEWMRDVISTRAKETGKSVGVPYAEAFRILELGV